MACHINLYSLLATKEFGAGGSIAQWFAYWFLDPAALSLIPFVPENFPEETTLLDDSMPLFIGSRQWLDIADRTHVGATLGTLQWNTIANL